MKYLTIQEIHCVGPGSCEQRIDPLTEALLDLEAVVDAITDLDLAADLATSCVDIQMIVDAGDLPKRRSRRLPPSARPSTLTAMQLRAGRHDSGDARGTGERRGLAAHNNVTAELGVETLLSIREYGSFLAEGSESQQPRSASCAVDARQFPIFLTSAC